MRGADVPLETMAVAPLLRSAIQALSTFDDAALEEFLAEAEAASAKMGRIGVQDISEAAALQQVFSEILSSTSRSLSTLERLRSRQEDAWVR